MAEGSGSIAERVSEKLRRGDELANLYAPARVRMSLDGPLATIWSQGHIEVGRLWQLYATYPYLDRLTNRRVLDDAILAVADSLVWQVEGFALATSWDGERYAGLWLPGDKPEPALLTDSTLLVRVERALAQRAAEAEEPASGPETENESDDVVGLPGEGGDPLPPVPPGPPGPPPRLRAEKRRYFGSTELSPARYAADFAKVTQEILQHLAATDGVELSVRLEISATASDGFAEHTVRTVRENATQLRFDASGFEES